MDREAHLRLGGGPNSVLTLPSADLKGRVAHGVRGQEPLDSGSQTDILKEGYPASLGHGRSLSNPPAQTVTSHSGQDHQHQRQSRHLFIDSSLCPQPLATLPGGLKSELLFPLRAFRGGGSLCSQSWPGILGNPSASAPRMLKLQV